MATKPDFSPAEVNRLKTAVAMSIASNERLAKKYPVGSAVRNAYDLEIEDLKRLLEKVSA